MTWDPSGGRVSNAWVTCPIARDNSSKGLLIPDTVIERRMVHVMKGLPL